MGPTLHGPRDPARLTPSRRRRARSGAGPASYDVPRELAPALGRVAARTDVPVRLPARLALDASGRVYATGAGSRRAWELTLAGAPDCGNATACFLAQFSGERGGKPAFRRTVRLARGLTGFYKPLSCGASCSPPMIQWRQRGVLYSIQANVAVRGADRQRRALVAAADSAIRARPR
jgi:hypothetical protein